MFFKGTFIYAEDICQIKLLNNTLEIKIFKHTKIIDECLKFNA